MAQDTRSLTVNLIANSRRFGRGIQNASKRFKKFGAAIATRAKQMAASMAVVGTAVAAMGAAFVRAGLRSVDALAKTARMLGTSIDDLQGFRAAAAQAGVDTKMFDTALRRMTRRVSEAAQGSGEAKNAIRELGLDAQRLNQMTPTEQLLEFADAFQHVESQADRVRLGFKLFDSEGVALINLLDQGSETIRNTADEMIRLRGSLSEVDAAGVERANDAMGKLWDIAQGLQQQLAIRLAPTLEALANASIVWIDSMGGAGAVIEKSFGNSVQIFQTIHDTISGIVKAVNTVKGVLLRLLAINPQLFGALTGSSEATAFAESLIKDANAATQKGFLANASAERNKREVDPENDLDFGAFGRTFREEFEKAQQRSKEMESEAQAKAEASAEKVTTETEKQNQNTQETANLWSQVEDMVKSTAEGAETSAKGARKHIEKALSTMGGSAGAAETGNSTAQRIMGGISDLAGGGGTSSQSSGQFRSARSGAFSAARSVTVGAAAGASSAQRSMMRNQGLGSGSEQTNGLLQKIAQATAATAANTAMRPAAVLG
jgi:hypothetical protein